MTTAGRVDSKPAARWNGLGLRAIEWLIGTLMIISAWLHLKNHAMFYLHAAQYRILPVSVLPMFVMAVPWLMLFSGMMILVRAGHPVGALVGTTIFIIFAIAQAWTILSGYDIDCGCFGSIAQKKVGVMSILLPIVLGAGCTLIALSRSHKS